MDKTIAQLADGIGQVLEWERLDREWRDEEAALNRAALVAATEKDYDRRESRRIQRSRRR